MCPGPRKQRLFPSHTITIQNMVSMIIIHYPDPRSNTESKIQLCLNKLVSTVAQKNICKIQKHNELSLSTQMLQPEKRIIKLQCHMLLNRFYQTYPFTHSKYATAGSKIYNEGMNLIKGRVLFYFVCSL